MTDNVVDLDQYRAIAEEVDAEIEQHEAFEEEITIAVAHSVAHKYVDKVMDLHPGASESFVIYSILQGLMGRVSHMLGDGDQGAPAILGWLNYISNAVAEGTGVTFDDASMDEAMGYIFEHRLGEPLPLQGPTEGGDQ